MKKIKNKKVILVLILFLGIAASFAYYTTTDSFENIFKTSKYGTKVEEVFESPDDWTPGDETSKTVIATNTGDVCENVRVSYTESWKSENNNDLPLVDPTLNEKIAIINFDNTNDWKQSGNYYYYNKNLLKNESTTSFIKSVTYNPNYATSGMNCTSTTEGNKTTKECSTGNDSYAGATYKLTITVETIQCDAMESEWGVTIAELNKKPYTIVSGDLDTVGSIVKIADEEFYVIGKENNYIKLLSKWNLNVGNAKNPNVPEGIQDESIKGKMDVGEVYGTVAYGNYVNFEDSQIKQYVDNYLVYLQQQGVFVSGRLLKIEELEELINHGNPLSYGSLINQASDLTGKEWIYQTSYWTQSTFAVQQKYMINGSAYLAVPSHASDNLGGVRPIILMEA